MTQEILVGAAPAPPSVRERRDTLRARVKRMTDTHAVRWSATPAEPPGARELGAPYSRWRQWGNRRRFDRLVKTLCREVLRCPGGEAERRTWEARLEEEITRFGERCLGWPASYRESTLGTAIHRATVEFNRRARALTRRHDIELAPGELFQALRNVWIMNGLQLLLGRPVAATPSVTAYSLLYPLTDNLLDDPQVPPGTKDAFNHRLGRRLAGRRPAAADPREAAVFELVGWIEGELPRHTYPDVFESLLAIHRGQVRSLAQQDRAGSGDVDLLAVSAEKGGTSVLADGYLVAGSLTAAEEEFLFGYGMALQLLDDLQDASADREAGHRTLFSEAIGECPLDGLTSRLARFTGAALGAAARFPVPEAGMVADLLSRNCALLLLQAVGQARPLFRPAYVRRLERHFPVRFAGLAALERRTERQVRRTERRLRRRGRGGMAGELSGLWMPVAG